MMDSHKMKLFLPEDFTVSNLNNLEEFSTLSCNKNGSFSCNQDIPPYPSDEIDHMLHLKINSTQSFYEDEDPATIIKLKPHSENDVLSDSSNRAQISYICNKKSYSNTDTACNFSWTIPKSECSSLDGGIHNTPSNVSNGWSSDTVKYNLLTPESFMLTENLSSPNSKGIELIVHSKSKDYESTISTAMKKEVHNVDSENFRTFDDISLSKNSPNFNLINTLPECNGKAEANDLSTNVFLNNENGHFSNKGSLKKAAARLDKIMGKSFVKRKLNFEDASTKYNFKYPQFSCNFKICEDIYVDSSKQSKENTTSLPVPLSFYKNPFPPIGVFWDIENCRIPKGLSATFVVQAVRNRFFDGFKEAEFVCVCDALKENPKVLEELNDTQINVIHVGSFVKNAADDKLLQCMRRFADIHGAGSTIVVISGDSDFAMELYDLRYRKKLHVILVHNAHAQDSLKMSAHETALFSDLTQEIPMKCVKSKANGLSREIFVWNLPCYIDTSLIKRRLHALSANCGGKGITIQKNFARIRFHNTELAARARKRIEGEDVFGYRVNCTFGKVTVRDSLKCRQSDPFNTQNFINNGDSDQSNQFNSESFRRNFREESPQMDQPLEGFWNKPYYNTNEGWNENGYAAWTIPSSPQIPNDQGCFNGHQVNSNRNRRTYYGSPVVFSRERERENPNIEERSNNCYGGRRTYNYRESENDCWNPPESPTDETWGMSNLSLGNSTQESLTGCSQNPIELLVTNLDPFIDIREMKKIIFSSFSEQVMVLHISVFVQSDGNMAATVTVPSSVDAQFAISQLHRRRIGFKKIAISCITPDNQPPEIKRSKVLALLREVPGKKLPLFKFREIYERRYQETISVADIYAMKDVVNVSDNYTGRMVFLNLEWGSLHSILGNSWCHPDELRYCKKHFISPDGLVGWAERDYSSILPRVWLTLSAVSDALELLLQTHTGRIPLASFIDCFCAEVGPLEEDPHGVSLEHLISCLPGISIVTEDNGFRFIKRRESKNKDTEECPRNANPLLVANTSLLSRELVDLLKTFPHCELTLSKFITAYHHHFGRQCRVADYGYTKLWDLLISLSHLIQIMGEGSKITVTLSHRAQVKRFSSDLLRVLRGHPSKLINLSDFPQAYERTMERKWNVTDYGVCKICDLLKEIQETTVVLKDTEEGTIVAVPKREQTAEEIQKTRLFAIEVIELLRHNPDCKMKFNRFIPSYHHHFGRQCRVSEYGFTKLIEIFEVIPDVVQIMDDEEDGEKILQLSTKERLKILGDQIFTLVKNAPNKAINVSVLSEVFLHYYGYCLKPCDYQCQDVVELIEKIEKFVKIEKNNEVLEVKLVDKSTANKLWEKSRSILWDEPNCSLNVGHFIEKYNSKFNHPPNMDEITKNLGDYMEIIEESDVAEVRLVPLQAFVRDFLVLMDEAGGRMAIANLDAAFLDRFGVTCRPANYGFPNMHTLLLHLGDMVSIKGSSKTRHFVVLNRERLPELPKYSPPPVTEPSPTAVRDKPKWNNFSCTRVAPHPPISNKSVPPTPHCGQQKPPSKDIPGSHLIMGLTPPSQQSYQHHTSPVIYPGSVGESVVWGQMWSPQYSVISPITPAPYMMSTIPFSWGNVSTPPVHNSTTFEGSPIPPHAKAPVSIKTLEQCEMEIGPPNPSELPSPDLLTINEAAPGEPISTGYVGAGPYDTKHFSTSTRTSGKKRLAPQFASYQ